MYGNLICSYSGLSPNPTGWGDGVRILFCGIQPKLPSVRRALLLAVGSVGAGCRVRREEPTRIFSWCFPNLQSLRFKFQT